jgi:hypothetical protein
VYRFLVGKVEGMRPLGRPRRRWEGNIKMDLLEVGCEGMDWIELARHPWESLAFYWCERNVWLGYVTGQLLNCDGVCASAEEITVFPECLHMAIIWTSVASYSKLSGEGNSLVRNLDRRLCCSMSPQALDKVIAVVTLVL